MKISDRHIKTQISNIVAGCRKYIFHPEDHKNMEKTFDAAQAKLEGIALLFSEGKMRRHLENYSNELSDLRRLVGIDS